MAFFQRGFGSEFAPMFRLLDDYASHAASRSNGGSTKSFRSWQPRFDVSETKESYTLQGEFPGIDQKDIDVSFTSENALTIRGRTERQHEEGTRPSALENGAQKPTITEGIEAEATEGSDTSSYHKATVEEEGSEGTIAGETPAETPAESTVATSEPASAPAQATKSRGPKYWVSERSVGEFSRTFSFPSRVDQENVKASLKNGILSVVVPKATLPENRRINVE